MFIAVLGSTNETIYTLAQLQDC